VALLKQIGDEIAAQKSARAGHKDPHACSGKLAAATRQCPGRFCFRNNEKAPWEVMSERDPGLDSPVHPDKPIANLMTLGDA
jgi:hypothetical protein